MKISIIGSGNVGITTALFLMEENLVSEVILFDILKGIPQGKVLDLYQSASLRKYNANLIGTNNIKDIKNSNLIIITAGLPRKPGMSRVDLLKSNGEIIKNVCKKIKKYSEDSLVIVVTNPVDIMCYLAKKITGFSPNKVFGLSGVLDTARFKYFILKELNFKKANIETFVLGTHCDEMIPLISHTFINGEPLNKLLSKKRIEKIINKTKFGGGEIVKLLNTSAYFAPAASVVEMIKALVKENKKILPASCYLQGEYGVFDVYLGVPAKFGKNGVEKIIELKLSDEEEIEFHNSAERIREEIGNLFIQILDKN